MKRFFYIILAVAAVLCACDGRPKDVLSRGDMEDVLYDYHMMQAIIDQLPDSTRERMAQDYINAVFEKHGITEAQFDSSITYYNRNTKDLTKIYTSLKARFEEANEAIQLQTGDNDLAAMFAGGDTANVWAGSKMLMLAGNDLMRSESFSIVCDTSCHQRDQFTLMFTPIFMKSRNESSGQSLVAGLSIVYKGGKTVGITQQMSSNNNQRMTLKANDSTDIAKVNIFFYFKGRDNLREACVVNNISLIQMHEKVDATKAAEAKADSVRTDSVKSDSLLADTIAPAPVRVLTPDEVRLENKSDKTIKIQEAPTIRHRNNDGMRRRPQRRKP